MVAQHLHRLGDEFAFVFPPRRNVTAAHLNQNFFFGLLAHSVVHKSGNTDFWRTNPFQAISSHSSGNKTFASDRVQNTPERRIDFKRSFDNVCVPLMGNT